MSFLPIRFFNTDAPETPSVASLMAKSGTITNGDSQVKIPVIIPEKKEEPAPTQTDAPAATAPATNEGKATPETPQPATEPIKATPQKEEPAKGQSWQEVLKQQQPNAIFKELGYDDKAIDFLLEAKTLDPKMVGFLNHWKSKGDPTSYLKAATTDYTKMPAESVLREQLREEYPKASEKALDALFKKELESYKLDADLYSPEEVEMSQLLLEARADKYRDTLIAKQQDYLFPAAPDVAPAVDVVSELTKTKEEALNTYKTALHQDPYFKDVISNKRIIIGEGADALALPVNPEGVEKALYDSEYTYSKIFDENGVPNMQKHMLIAAITEDHVGFLAGLEKHYRALGAKSAIDPIENASLPNGSSPAKAETTPANAAEAMAKGGRLVSGG